MTDTHLWRKVLLDFDLFEMSDDEVIYYPSIMEVVDSPYGPDALDPETQTVAVVQATQEEVEQWSDQHTHLVAAMADIEADERQLTAEYRKRRQLITNRRNDAFDKYQATQNEIQRRLDTAMRLRAAYKKEHPDA